MNRMKKKTLLNFINIIHISVKSINMKNNIIKSKKCKNIIIYYLNQICIFDKQKIIQREIIQYQKMLLYKNKTTTNNIHNNKKIFFPKVVSHL